MSRYGQVIRKRQMFGDKNGGILDRKLCKEKAVICIFIQRCVGLPSPQFQSNEHYD